jgi:hypothetical protein
VKEKNIGEEKKKLMSAGKFRGWEVGDKGGGKEEYFGIVLVSECCNLFSFLD